MEPSSYDTYRVGDRETNRDITQVPLAEIVNAIVDTVGQSGSLTGESIIPAVGRALGYSRSGNNVKAKLDLTGLCGGINYGAYLRGTD